MTREKAIKIVKEFINGTCLHLVDQEALETLIPELKESEDERIIKTLQEYVKNRNWPLNGPTQDEVLAWLEKQKERKPADLPPGFYFIDQDGNKYYSKEFRFNNGTFTTTMKVKEEQKSNFSEKDSTDFEIEVHEIIAQARNDSRLDDADVLKQFEEEAAFALMLKANKLIEQKPSWSEEDERMLSRCVKSIEASKQFAGSDTFKKAKDKEISWLKDLLNRFNIQSKQEWSEEDEDFINMLILHFNYLIDKGGDSVETYKSYREKLKSLRPQPHTVSIKDATKFGNLEYERGVKDGIQHAKNHQWKPSEEQMKALLVAIGDEKERGSDVVKSLRSLYYDLKNSK